MNFQCLTSSSTQIRELQRSIETYDMRYSPQHVLLCTSTAHDQWANICIHGYLRILWIRNTKSSTTKKNEFINVMLIVLNWGISLKVVKLNPWMGITIICNKLPWDGTIKTYRKNVACRAGSAIGLRSPPCERRYAVCVVCDKDGFEEKKTHLV